MSLVRENKWEIEAIEKEEKLNKAIAELNEYAKHLIELKEAQRRAKCETEEAWKRSKAAIKDT